MLPNLWFKIYFKFKNTIHVKSLTLDLEEILKKNNKKIKSIETDLNSTQAF